jgi:hypothetical protein
VRENDAYDPVSARGADPEIPDSRPVPPRFGRACPHYRAMMRGYDPTGAGMYPSLMKDFVNLEFNLFLLLVRRALQAPFKVRSGQVRFITRPKSRTMRATRQLMLPPSTVS